MTDNNNEPSLIRYIIFSMAFAVFVLSTGLGFLSCNPTDSQFSGSPEKVTVAYATLPETALAQVAQAKGYMLNEGLEVIPHLHSFGKLALQEVIEGKADFATVAETPVMLAIMNGEKISIVATIQSSTRNHAIVAKKNKDIMAPQDLKGKKIGTTLGITADFYLDAFLATAGISRKEIRVVNLKPEEQQSAIAEGRVDAISTFYPFLRRVQNELGDNGITFYQQDIYTETFNLVVTQEFMRKNQDKIKRILRALFRAKEFVRQNPAEAQKIVADFIKTDLKIVRDVWADNNFDVSLEQSLILALEDESRWAIRNGLTSAKNIPNYLDFIHIDSLRAIKPEAVRIIK